MWMVAGAAFAQPEQLVQLQILADPSIALPLTRAAREYSRLHEVSISVSFASSDEQLRRMEQGTVADIFVTTRKDILEQMKNQGLIDIYSRAALVKNRLSLVTYRKNEFQLILIPKLPLAEILERVDHDFIFAMPDPEFFDFGVASMEALMNHELAETLEPHFRFYQTATEMEDVLSKRGGYGILPLTEAMQNPKLKVLGTFPETAHQPLVYDAVVMAGDHMKASREFLAYLSLPDVIAGFAEYGFQPLKADSSDKDHLARGSTFNPSTNPL